MSVCFQTCRTVKQYLAYNEMVIYWNQWKFDKRGEKYGKIGVFNSRSGRIARD